MKRLFSLILSFILLLGSAMPVMADESSSARTVVIFQVEGNDAKMTKGTEKEFSAKAGLKLFEGYTVATGDDSYVYLKLDDSSLVKIDPKSKISISKASSSKLSVTVLSGAITVNAHEQKEDEVMEIRAGNSALAIRGTLFTVEQPYNGNVAITMIEGSGYVDDHYLPVGNTMDILDEKDKLDKRHVLRKSEINEATSAVVLRAVLENQDELGDYFTEKDLKNITELLEIKEQEEKKSPTISSSDAPKSRNNTYYRDKKTTPTDENDDNDNSDDTPPISEYVAYIGSKGYLTVIDAISAAVPGDNIKVTSSASIRANSSIISGVTLTVESPATLSSNADLTVNGTLTVANGATFKNNGVLTNNSNNTVNIDGYFYNYAMFENALTGKTAIGTTGTLYLGGISTFKNEGNLEINGHFTGSTGGKFYFGSGASLTGTSNTLTVIPDFWYIISDGGEFLAFPVHNQSTGIYYETIREAIANSADNETISVTRSLTETTSSNIVISEFVKLDISADASVTLTCDNFVNNGCIELYADSRLNLTTSGVFENNGIFEANDTRDITLNCGVINSGMIFATSASPASFSVKGLFTNCYEDINGSAIIIDGYNATFDSGLINYGVFTFEGGGNLNIQGDITAANGAPLTQTGVSFVNGDGNNEVEGQFSFKDGDFTCNSIDNQFGKIIFDDVLSAKINGKVYNTGGKYDPSGPSVEIKEYVEFTVDGGGFYTQGMNGAPIPGIQEGITYIYINGAGGGEPGWYDITLP